MTTVDKSTPVQVMTGVKTMDAGILHYVILKTDNTVWSVGVNSQGQLGNGNMVNRTTPVQIML